MRERAPSAVGRFRTSVPCTYRWRYKTEFRHRLNPSRDNQPFEKEGPENELLERRRGDQVTNHLGRTPLGRQLVAVDRPCKETQDRKNAEQDYVGKASRSERHDVMFQKIPARRRAGAPPHTIAGQDQSGHVHGSSNLLLYLAREHQPDD